MKLHKQCKVEVAASKDATRPMINEPWLDLTKPENPVIVATNGAIMAIVPVEVDDHDKAGCVTGECLKASRKPKLTGEITCNGSLSVLNGPTFTRPEQQFPNWRQVMPDLEAKPAHTVKLNARLLWELAQAMGCEAVELEIRDSSMAIYVKPCAVSRHDSHASEAANWDSRGLIMPMV